MTLLTPPSSRDWKSSRMRSAFSTECRVNRCTGVQGVCQSSPQTQLLPEQRTLGLVAAYRAMQGFSRSSALAGAENCPTSTHIRDFTHAGVSRWFDSAGGPCPWRGDNTA